MFTFLNKILYKHGNLKYVNNFHTFLGLQKAKFDSLRPDSTSAFLGEMRNISHEMKSCMRSKDKLGFARKIFASPVSRSQFYSLRKRKESANSIESLMCSHPYFAHTISREEFRRRGIRPLSHFLKWVRLKCGSGTERMRNGTDAERNG